MRCRLALLAAAAIVIAGCGASPGADHATTVKARRAAAVRTTSAAGALPRARPQALEPVAGASAGPGPKTPPATATPVGDVNAHAPPLSEIRQQLQLELVAVPVSNATYIDPLRFVDVWGRTDQGVDAGMPVGAPILAPCRVKVLAIIPNWFAGQPLIYFELLQGPDAGKVQYVAEQITGLARAGSVLRQGQPVARFARSGTDIEYGWSTLNGVTLARATSGYEEGQITPAGRSIRAWLNALGAHAGPST